MGDEGIYATSDGVAFTAISSSVQASQAGFFVSNGIGFFDALSDTSVPENVGLWRTDGTQAGTYAINPTGTVLNPVSFGTAAGGLTAFINEGSNGSGTLWVTNGSASGTTEITNAALGANLNTAIKMVSLNGKAAFAAVNAAGDYSVWTTDGTSAGTVQIFDGGDAGASTRPLTSIAAYGTDLVITSGYGIYVYDGTGVVGLPLPTTGGGNAVPQSYTIAGSKLFIAAPTDNGVSNQVFVSDGTAAGTVAVDIPGLASINGPLTTVGTSVAFEGIDSSGKQALFETDGTAAGSKELGLPAGATVNASTVIAALAAPIPPATQLTGTLPNPLYVGTETVTGTGGIAGLQVERITQGTYNTPGSTGWVKATVAANGDWTAQLTFDKPGQLAHVYAENGGSTRVVDLVDGTPGTAPVNPPPPPTLIGMLPNPLYTGVETVSGYGGIRGLRVERITQGTYNTPGSTGWVTASVAGNGDWTAELTFDKPGQLAHVYAQNGGTGAVFDLVNGTPIAAVASNISGSIAADMTAKASLPTAASSITMHPGGATTGGSAMSVLSTQTAAAVVPDHIKTVQHGT